MFLRWCAGEKNKMIYISSSCVKADTIKESILTLVREGFRNIELSGGTKYYDSLIDDLLELKDKFGLYYKISKRIEIIDAAKTKINYFSTNKLAKSMGYIPSKTSIDGLIIEINLIDEKYE